MVCVFEMELSVMVRCNDNDDDGNDDENDHDAEWVTGVLHSSLDFGQKEKEEALFSSVHRKEGDHCSCHR